MNTLRTAAQQALEALLTYEQYIQPLTDVFGGPRVPEAGSASAKVDAAITALRAALAEPSKEYERGVIDGMQRQAQSSVDRAVNRMAALAEPVQEPVAWMDREGDLYKMPEIEGWAPPHTMLYAAPPQHKPLTEEEIEQEYKKGYADGYAAGYDNGDSEGFTRGTDSMVPASLAAWRAETKPLTEAQIYAAIKGIDSLKAVEVARAIERAHGIT